MTISLAGFRRHSVFRLDKNICEKLRNRVAGAQVDLQSPSPQPRILPLVRRQEFPPLPLPNFGELWPSLFPAVGVWSRKV